MNKLLLYIPGNLSSGGIRELKKFLKKIDLTNNELTVLSKKRYKSFFNNDTKYISASSSRIINEIRIRSYSSSFNTIICFSNLPSLFKLNCNQYVLIQNRYLIEKKLPKGMSLVFFIKMSVQRIFLKFFIRNCSFIVQTLTMVFHLKKYGINEEKIFLINDEQLNDSQCRHYNKRMTTFFYPTSIDPHKNISRLISAWNILATSKIKAKLEITISDEYLHKINKDYANPNIVSAGFISEDDVLCKIKNCDYLIYPSLIESYGYSLEDADILSKNIISSESSYIYDVCKPKITFDPGCEFSIARSVARVIQSEDIFLKNYFKKIKPFAL